MTAGSRASDFVVRYAAKSAEQKPAFLASHEPPFTMTQSESLAARFGKSLADDLAKQYAFYSPTHNSAEVVSVPRVGSMV